MDDLDEMIAQLLPELTDDQLLELLACIDELLRG